MKFKQKEEEGNVPRQIDQEKQNSPHLAKSENTAVKVFHSSGEFIFPTHFSKAPAFTQQIEWPDSFQIANSLSLSLVGNFLFHDCTQGGPGSSEPLGTGRKRSSTHFPE